MTTEGAGAELASCSQVHGSRVTSADWLFRPTHRLDGVDDRPDSGWFWGESYQLTAKKGCGQRSMRSSGRSLSCKVQCASVGSFLI
jgi:hypothetical protein